MMKSVLPLLSNPDNKWPQRAHELVAAVIGNRAHPNRSARERGKAAGLAIPQVPSRIHSALQVWHAA